MEAGFRVVRILWIGALLSGFLFVLIPVLTHIPTKSIGTTFYWIMVVYAALMLVVMMIVYKMAVLRATRTLRTNPGDRRALGRWGAGHIGIIGFCEVIILIGLIMRYMGATSGQADLFFILGLVPMVILRPRRLT